MMVDFCLPAKNEGPILKTNVLKLFKWLKTHPQEFDWRLTIVVNGSTDDSASKAKALSEDFPTLISYLIISEGGKGRALRQFFQSSLADVVAFMDIDLAVDLSAIPSLIQPLINHEADMVIGSRLVGGAKVERTIDREISSRVYNFIARIFLGGGINDLQCGFKAIRGSAYKVIAPHLQDNAWFFDTELVAWALQVKMRIKEIPVIWSEHYYDSRQSKVKVMKDAWKFMLALILLKHRLITTRVNPDSV